VDRDTRIWNGIGAGVLAVLITVGILDIFGGCAEFLKAA